MVALEELAIVIPLVTSIAIPVVIIGLTRYMKTSESLSRTTIVATEALKDLEGYVSNHKRETREIWQRIEALDKALYNTCYRLDRIERDHEAGRNV